MIVAFAIVICAFFIAAMEVQIEGKNGWASALPTWCIRHPNVCRVIGGRPLTGYHVFLTLSILSLLHVAFLLTPWSLSREFFLIGFWITMMTVEDFLWFIINPHFGLREFHRRNEHLWWHSSWTLGLPTFYWFVIPIGVLMMTVL